MSQPHHPLRRNRAPIVIAPNGIRALTGISDFFCGPGEYPYAPRIKRENAPNPADREHIDPDLAAVVRAWAKLPDAVRAGILAMILASGRTSD